MKVVVEEIYDGDGLTVFMKNFDQEDTLEELPSVFKFLGFDSEHTEIY